MASPQHSFAGGRFYPNRCQAGNCGLPFENPIHFPDSTPPDRVARHRRAAELLDQIISADVRGFNVKINRDDAIHRIELVLADVYADGQRDGPDSGSK